jgi:hypothetical protein
MNWIAGITNIFMNNDNLKFWREFRLVSLCPGFVSTPLTNALSKVPFYKYIPVVILFLLLIQLCVKLLIIIYCLKYACIITYIHTFTMVTFDTGTNFPAVSCNSLLAVAMMNIRHRWNGIRVPTQSHPNAVSLTLSAWKFLQLMVYLSVCHAALSSMYQLTGTRVVMSDVNYPDGFPKTLISFSISTYSICPRLCVSYL